MGIIRMAIYIYILGISLFYTWYNNNGNIVVIWKYNGDMGKSLWDGMGILRICN
jgi:hypothetical protein